MSKLKSYIGFARKSGNLVTGTATVIYTMEKKKVKLLIISEDASENTKKKLIKIAEKNNIKYVIYENGQELSDGAGQGYKTSFAVLDDNFAKVILNEIDS